MQQGQIKLNVIEIIQLFIINMKKGGNSSNDRNQECKPIQKSMSQIKFNLSANNLACFKGKQKPTLTKIKIEPIKQIKFLSQLKAVNTIKNELGPPLTQRTRAISCNSSFNQTVVIMQYDNIDVYVDHSKRKKSNSKDSNGSRKNGKKSEGQEGCEDQFLQSCVRKITEQTDNTSNTISLSAYHMSPGALTPRSSQHNQFYPEHSQQYEGYYQQQIGYIPYNLNVAQSQHQERIRNRQSVSFQESKRFIIYPENIEQDGRTTVMVKNIPNKYTQQMLLQQFTVNNENKFDFFYLPIDKDYDCNVGYAFVNFVNTAYLRDFYKEFHQQKWKIKKSPKICNICYARYQGTLQLADHFKHTKIINQKDKKVRPLIGITQASRIKDIRQIIKNQKSQQLVKQCAQE